MLLSEVPTTISLTISSPSTVYGQGETINAAVTAESSSATPSGGSITFRDGANVLATVPMPDAAVGLGGVVLGAGTHSLTASYSGDGANFAPSTTGSIETVAGSSYVADGIPATTAQLNHPSAVAVDSAGDVFIADTYDNRIREVVAGSRAIITVAGNGTAGSAGDRGGATAAQLDWPEGLAVDSSGNLFIADTGNNQIREVVKASGDIVTVAGNGTAGLSGDGGPALSAQFNAPQGLALDSAGDLFIADSGNNQVRELVAATGNLVTVAGNGSFGANGDGGSATAASLSVPTGVAVDPAGNVFIADSGSSRIREVVEATGKIITVAGGGTAGLGDGGSPLAAQLANPEGVSVDASGDLFIADFNDFRIREVLKATGKIVTVAGTGSPGNSGDGGPAVSASLLFPEAVAVDSAGDLFVADSGNQRVRELVNSSGNMIAFAGNGTGAYRGDGGLATDAEISFPGDVAVDSLGNLFIADTANQRVREVVKTTGDIVTVAGNGTAGFGGDGGPATAAELYDPRGIAVDSAGNLFISGDNDQIREVVKATGDIITVAGTGTYGFGGDGGPAISASFRGPEGLATDSTGDLFIADSGNHRIRELVKATGDIVTVAGDGNGSYGGDGGLAVDGQLDDPYDVAVDAGGDLFIADTGNNRIREVAAATSTLSTVAGVGAGVAGGDGGPAVNAVLATPYGVAVDPSGDVFIADTLGNRVREVVAATGDIVTVAGTGARGFGGDGGPAAAALLDRPQGLAADAAGNVFIAETYGNRIRQIEPSAMVTVTAATTATAVTASPTSTTYGQPLTLTGTVTNLSSGPVPNGGTVTFRDGNLVLGSAPLKNGVSSLSTAALPAGPDDVTATYGGDGLDFAPSGAGMIATVAGTNNVPGGMPAVGAQLDTPAGVAVDSAGDVFIADTAHNVVREVLAATGTIITVAGNGTTGFSGDGGPATAAALNSPGGVAVDAAGNLFIADSGNGRIREVLAATGDISTVAGGGFVFGDGVAATAAVLYSPRGVALDAAGDLFIADPYADKVYEVMVASGDIVTVAGNGTSGSQGDGGAATAAQLASPYGVAVDPASDVFIADTNNQRIREVVKATGNIMTVAGDGTPGSGGDGGLAAAAQLDYPHGVTLDSAGNLFIVNLYGQVREVVKSTGDITTVAGGPSTGFGGDGGPATAALLESPLGIAIDSAGDLFIADTYNNRIREVFKVGGDINTIAGDGLANRGGDGGPATAALLNGPEAVAVDSAGNLFISDTQNDQVREVVKATGAIVTVAGTGTYGVSGNGGPATEAQFAAPYGIAVDSSGDLFIADVNGDEVREVVASTGDIVAVAGNGRPGYGGDGGPSTSAELQYPQGVAVDSAGDVFIADTYNNRIREVVKATGDIYTVAGNGTAGFSGDGGVATNAELDQPEGIAVDPAGNLFIADAFNHRIREVVKATGDIITFAGGGSGGDGSPAASAQLEYPSTIALDAAGDLLIADPTFGRVYEVSHATGALFTVAGDGGSGYQSDGGPATATDLDAPAGVAVDAAGDVFIADTTNNRIRVVGLGESIKVSAAATTTTVAASSASAVSGQSVTFTATVKANSPSTAVPSGTVQFQIDGSNFGSPVGLVNGAAMSEPISSLSVGTHTVTAVYVGGGGNFVGSTGTLSGGETIATPTAVPVIDDNAGAGYAQTGSWTAANGYGGYNNAYAYAAPVTGPATATASWTTNKLAPGYYDVQVTWGAGSNRATNAPYQVYDGTTLLGTFTVNQKLAPSGPTAGGVMFQSLGVFRVTSSTLRVVLGNNANGYVVADAVRVAAPTSVPVVDDNAGPGYVQTGTWTTATGYGGYSNAYAYAAPVTGSATAIASWTSTGLAPRYYDVQVTWGAGSNRATNASYQIYDGNTLLATVAVNQKAAPSGSSFGGAMFQSLGVYNVSSGTLRVVLGNNANGYVVADAVRVAPTTAVPAIADDRGPGYVETGTWTAADGYGGYNNSYVYAAPTSGTATGTASWTTSGIAPGSYDVQVTWGAGSNRATNAPYQVYDGSTLLATVMVNQKVAPSGTTANGVAFQSLGVFHVTSGTLRVVLGNNANGYVIADAVRIALSEVTDNGAAGYAQTGTWTGASGYGGYNNNYVYAAPVTGTATASATWTTTGLVPGSYDVQVTWGAGSNRATNATYQVYDGSTLLATVAVNQKLAPSGATVGGVAFQSLGVFNVTSGTLRVVLGNNANGYVVADAVRIASGQSA